MNPANSDYENNSEDPKESFDGKARKRTIGHDPPPSPEKPVCGISELCGDCPYPAHGFICWSGDGDCLRKRMTRINQKMKGEN